MPVASMHKQYPPTRGKHQIRSPRKRRHMEPIPISHAVEQMPDEHLRLCVAGAYASHVSAALLSADAVHFVDLRRIKRNSFSFENLPSSAPCARTPLV